MKNPIYPCLWFDQVGREAAELYCSVFKNSSILSDNGMVIIFELDGNKFMALNGGPHFKINYTISFSIVFDSIAEINEAWDKLSPNGTIMMALNKYDWNERYGWIQDKYGVSWQISLASKDLEIPKIIPSFLFVGDQKGRAEEAIHYYLSIFDHSNVHHIMKYTESDPDVTGFVKHGLFNLDKNTFVAMDSSGPHHASFNEGISFVIECESQKEIDYYWNNLAKGGMESQCGWLKDKFGVSWQIVPSILAKLMSDPKKQPKVVEAFMKMKKFDIETLLKA